ncbi:hypothetical protein CUMW_112460 [Citrus unshiu]|nr:hypothetical protein CUMW_112460 [Citrus unshiu]
MVISSSNPQNRELAIRKRIASMYLSLSLSHSQICN